MGKLKLSLIAVAATLALALGALGCGEDDDGSAPEAAAETEATTEEPAAPPEGEDEGAAKDESKPDRNTPAADGTAIKLDDSQFGPVLFDGAGQAIYLFDKETTEESRCYGECAAEWPPVLTEGKPQAQDGIAQGKLGTVDRRDGTRQVTYNGHPLYFYAHEAPNEVRCHNIPGFGGIWLALDADGNPA